MKPNDDILTQKTEAFRHSENHLFPPVFECCELKVVCHRQNYCASQLARAVEDADAHLLNMNITSEQLPNNHIAIELRISHRNAGSVARSLERYGYEVSDIFSGFDIDAELTDHRINELMTHMQV